MELDADEPQGPPDRILGQPTWVGGGGGAGKILVGGGEKRRFSLAPLAPLGPRRIWLKHCEETTVTWRNARNSCVPETTGFQQVVARERANTPSKAQQKADTDHMRKARKQNTFCGSKNPCRGSQRKMRGHQSHIMTFFLVFLVTVQLCKKLVLNVLDQPQKHPQHPTWWTHRGFCLKKVLPCWLSNVGRATGTTPVW